ncbi:MAG: PilW family protein, partial [Candidatus Methylomirabilales bacterium]
SHRPPGIISAFDNGKISGGTMRIRDFRRGCNRFVRPRPLVGGFLTEIRGLTLVEILIATGIFLVLLFGIYSIFESSRTTHAAGDARVDVQQNARLAMEITATDLRLAGYGFPPGAGAITAATPTSISFWADLTNGSTILTSDVSPGDATLTVEDTGGIKVGDIIYLINGAQSEQLTVSVVGPGTNTVAVTSGAVAAYPAGAQVTRPKLIAYSLNGGSVQKDDGEGGGVQPLADNVQTLQFRYFDESDVEIPAGSLAANLANIRRIRILVTVQSPPGWVRPQAYTLRSDIRVRNL